MNVKRKEGYRRRKARNKQYISGRIKTNREILLNKYGLSDIDYKVILLRQRVKCPICLEKLDNTRTVIDHCHRTGKVRGILHIKCNALLGMANDSIGILDNAIGYLHNTR